MELKQDRESKGESLRGMQRVLGARQTEIGTTYYRNSKNRFGDCPQTFESSEMFRFWITTVLTALIFVMPAALCQSAETSHWKEKISIDRMSDERIVTMTSAAIWPIRQFGRNVSATLVMQCLDAGGLKYVGVAVVFSERVTIDHIGARYRIDDDPVQLKMASLLNNGKGLAIGWESLVARLPASSKLRVEFELPWAGNAVVEFNTAGADKALARIPCRPSKG